MSVGTIYFLVYLSKANEQELIIFLGVSDPCQFFLIIMAARCETCSDPISYSNYSVSNLSEDTLSKDTHIGCCWRITADKEEVFFFFEQKAHNLPTEFASKMQDALSLVIPFPPSLLDKSHYQLVACSL